MKAPSCAAAKVPVAGSRRRIDELSRTYIDVVEVALHTPIGSLKRVTQREPLTCMRSGGETIGVPATAVRARLVVSTRSMLELLERKSLPLGLTAAALSGPNSGMLPTRGLVA